MLRGQSVCFSVLNAFFGVCGFRSAATIFGLVSCFLSVFAAANISFPVGLFSEFFSRVLSLTVSILHSLLLFEKTLLHASENSASRPGLASVIYFHTKTTSRSMEETVLCECKSDH